MRQYKKDALCIEFIRMKKYKNDAICSELNRMRQYKNDALCSGVSKMVSQYKAKIKLCVACTMYNLHFNVK